MINTTIHNYKELVKGRDRSNSWNPDPVKDLSKSRNQSNGLKSKTSLHILRKITADELLLKQKTAFLQKLSPMLKPISPNPNIGIFENGIAMPNLNLDERDEQPIL